MTENSELHRHQRDGDDLTASAARGARTVRVVIGSSLDDLIAIKTGSTPAAVVAIEREALVLNQLRHPNIVDLLRTERGEGTATLVTQFAGRDTLAHFQPIDAPTVARIGASLLTIVGELHAMGWVHGRLAADHCILGNGGRLTLCAFGAAHRADASDPRRVAETAAAVEIVTALADRLAEPTDRADRRRHRELRSILDVVPAALTSARSEQIRIALGALGGVATSSPARLGGSIADEATTHPTGLHTTRPSTRSRTGARTAPRQTGRLNGIVVSVTTLVVLLATVALLRWLGGPLGSDVGASTVRRVGDVPAPIALALTILRIAAFAACVYGIVLAAATLAAVITRRPDIERIATAMAPPRLRRMLVGLIGLGVLSSAATGAAPGPPPTGVATTTTTTATTDAPPTGVSPPTTVDVGTLAATAAVVPETAVPDSAMPSDDPPNDAAPAATLPNLWVMGPGDHLWGVADAALSAHLGRPAMNREIDAYWRSLVHLNRASLIDPDNPDLVFAGQVVELPPFG